MRIVVGGMNHESNTLNPIITGEDDFIVFRGDEILGRGMMPFYSSTGIVETLKEAGCAIVPTVLARAVPNGVVSVEFYTRLKEELLERVRQAMEDGPIDGACFALHGSMKVQGLGCAEGDLLGAFRKLLPRIPMTIALDMHATITDELLRHGNGFVGYKTAPHVDCRETGAHAARMLLASISSGKKLVTLRRSVPMLVAGEKSESEVEPLRSLIAACRSAERLPGIMAASYLLGFPWADDEHNGVSVLVTALEDPPARLREGRRAAAGQAAAGTGVADVGVATEAVAVKLAAEAVAVKLAADFWKRRRDFVFRSEYYDSRTSMDVAYKAVLEQSQRPVFVSDSGDNPTAGSTGDSTELFEAILATMDTVDKLPTPLLYSGFYDAAAAAACISAATAAAAANNLAGVDGGAAAAEVDLVVGGTWDKINGKRIPLRVRILAIRKDHGPYRSDLVLVGHGNLRLVLSSKHIGFGDGDLLPALGVKAEDYCLVVVKLGYLEPCFRSIAARAIMATSKGCSNEVLESIPYAKIRRPIYPLDPDMEFEVGKK